MKEKIKNASKKNLVEAYQLQIRNSINAILSLELKLSPKKREYINALEKNIINAPYVLGYLEHSEKNKK